MVTTKLVTADDLLEMGEDAPFELIRGELVEVTPTKFWHMLVSGRFARYLDRYSVTGVPGEMLVGEGGFFLERDPDTVIAPDVSFMRAERIPPAEERDQYSLIPPDVVVEVLSPLNTKRRSAQKVEIYLQAGASLVWVADPDRKAIAAHTRDGQVPIYRVGEDLDGGDVLPGFRVPVAEFFK